MGGNEEQAVAPVLFYMQEFYCLDNFSAFKVLWQGTEYMTAEHAYQAAKFDHLQTMGNYICGASSAHEAKRIAKTFAHHVRPDWSEVRVAVMEDVLRAKMHQHEFVREKLLETGDREIIEDSPKDTFWGRGPNGDGENNVGKIWMKLRAELQKEASR